MEWGSTAGIDSGAIHVNTDVAIGSNYEGLYGYEFKWQGQMREVTRREFMEAYPDAFEERRRQFEQGIADPCSEQYVREPKVRYKEEDLTSTNASACPMARVLGASTHPHFWKPATIGSRTHLKGTLYAP